MELGIATQWPQLTLVACLDASPTYTEALEKEVRIDPKKTTNMTITLIKTKAKSKGLKNISAICKTFEAYESDTKFNLIVAVHAWYLFLLLFVHFFLLFFLPSNMWTGMHLERTKRSWRRPRACWPQGEG